MASAHLIRQASTRKDPQSGETRAHGEDEPLLGLEDIEGAISNVPDETQPTQQPIPDQFNDLPVFANIWRIRRDILRSIVDPYSLDQLRAPRLNTAVVRPLLEQYYDLHDLSIVYCLLINRVQFLREQSYQAHYQSVNTSRALLCEILALKLLRQFDEDSSGRKGLLLLANILIAGFEPFQNAPMSLRRGRRSSQARENPSQLASYRRQGSERQMTALEIAIISGSKLFLSSPACQKVVDAIYVGRIVYTPTSFIDIIPDHYKWSGITLYNPRKSPLLNQYRLVVPRTRNAIEIAEFIVLLGLFFWVMETRNASKFTMAEVVFSIYTVGWMLEQFASMLEHGWHVYSQNLWSFLDVMFCLIYLVYFSLRVHGLRGGAGPDVSGPALDILALAAPILVPRLAFNIWSENLVFVSLRDMMSKFILLTIFAVWTFTGFFLSMLWLSEGKHTPGTIAKWMIWVWFGLDGTGIGRSTEFHGYLGPLCMITFCVLGNTLFLTILVSTLSNTFSTITRNSVAEVQFRRAVLTFEGVKSDAIFLYLPPTNVVALLVLLPLKFVVSPRWFHKINVAMVRTVNAPLLLLVGLYERITLWPSIRNINDSGRAKYAHRTSRWDTTHFARWQVHGDIQAVFKAPPPDDHSTEDGDVAAYDHDSDDFLSEEGERNTSPHPDPQKARQSNTLVSGAPETNDQRDQRIQRTESSGEQGARPSITRYPSSRQRKLSVWSNDGLEARVAGMLEDHEEQATLGVHQSNESVLARLGGLEENVARIAQMVSRICETLDDTAQVNAAGNE